MIRKISQGDTLHLGGHILVERGGGEVGVRRKVYVPITIYVSMTIIHILLSLFQKRALVLISVNNKIRRRRMKFIYLTRLNTIYILYLHVRKGYYSFLAVRKTRSPIARVGWGGGGGRGDLGDFFFFLIR